MGEDDSSRIALVALAPASSASRSGSSKSRGINVPGSTIPAVARALHFIRKVASEGEGSSQQPVRFIGLQKGGKVRKVGENSKMGRKVCEILDQNRPGIPYYRVSLNRKVTEVVHCRVHTCALKECVCFFYRKSF